MKRSRGKAKSCHGAHFAVSLNVVMASVPICVPHPYTHTRPAIRRRMSCVCVSVWNLNKLIRCIRHILAEEGEDPSTSAFRTRNQPKVKGESACGMPHTVC